jgi:hypothetical protein
MRAAFPSISALRSCSLHVAMIDRVASTQRLSGPPARQIRQSLPQTTRFQPKAAMQCST